jgi:cyclopropane fatty-acyl-phospholipid synthase-like methyltransferase
MTESTRNDLLREEFNRWAEAGRGEHMEREHRLIAEKTLSLMRLAPTDNLLDVGCGAGWLLRTLAATCPDGRVIGMDVADEMVRRARQHCADLDNVMVVPGSSDEIPWQNNFFDKVISVESAYYWPHPARGIAEIFRVLKERGSAWLLINYFQDNPHCHQWGPQLAVPTHLLSADQWTEMFRAAGFVDVAHQRIVDDTPTPGVYQGKWFRDAAQLAAFRAAGALLVHGVKPSD